MFKAMTYRELKKEIGKFDEKQLDMNVSIFDHQDKEMKELGWVEYTDPEVHDILDPNHPFLNIGATSEFSG